VQPSEEKCEACGLPKVKVIRRGSPVKLQCIDPDCQSNQGKESAGACPECGKELRVLYSRAGKRFIGCSGYPECKRTYPLPQFGTLQFLGEKCPECGAPTLKVLGRGGWQFCANMECPTSKKAKAKKEGEEPKKTAKKTVKKTATKKAVKKAEDEGTETGVAVKKTVKKTTKKAAKTVKKDRAEAVKPAKKTVKKTAKKPAAKTSKKKVSSAE